MNVGDRVFAWYRQHSMPTRSLGTITKIEGAGWVTVKIDEPDLETGDLVCVQMNFIEPQSGGTT